MISPIDPEQLKNKDITSENILRHMIIEEEQVLKELFQNLQIFLKNVNE